MQEATPSPYDSILQIIMNWQAYPSSPIQVNGFLEDKNSFPKEIIFLLTSEFDLNCNGLPKNFKVPHVSFVTTSLNEGNEKNLQGDMDRLTELLKSYDDKVGVRIAEEMQNCIDKFGDQAQFF